MSLGFTVTATKEEFEARQKEVETVCMPIMTKLYQQAAQDQAPPGSAPPQNAHQNAPDHEPTIDEVD